MLVGAESDGENSTMAQRAADWFRQAEHDPFLAEQLRQAGWHEWACFAVHRAAEKAVKALHHALGRDIWGHAVARLPAQLPETAQPPSELIERARYLDTLYIPTRYPDSRPEGAPFEHHGPLQSAQASGVRPCHRGLRPPAPGPAATRLTVPCAHGLRPWCGNMLSRRSAALVPSALMPAATGDSGATST